MHIVAKATTAKINAPCAPKPWPGKVHLWSSVHCLRQSLDRISSKSFSVPSNPLLQQNGFPMPDVTELDHALSAQPASRVCSPGRSPLSVDIPSENSTREGLSPAVHCQSCLYTSVPGRGSRLLERSTFCNGLSPNATWLREHSVSSVEAKGPTDSYAKLSTSKR